MKVLHPRLSQHVCLRCTIWTKLCSTCNAHDGIKEMFSQSALSALTCKCLWLASHCKDVSSSCINPIHSSIISMGIEVTKYYAVSPLKIDLEALLPSLSHIWHVSATNFKADRLINPTLHSLSLPVFVNSGAFLFDVFEEQCTVWHSCEFNFM